MLPKPMLAERSQGDPRDVIEQLVRASWIPEVKLDGARQVLRIQGGRVVEMRSRPRAGQEEGIESRIRFPEVVAKLEAMELPDCVLDGEVGYIKDNPLRMDVNVLQSRPRTNAFAIKAHAQMFPMDFVAFDLLEIKDNTGRSQNGMGQPYSERRRLLDRLGPKGLSIAARAPPGATPAPGDAVEQALDFFDEIIGAAGEGVMLKNPLGVYEPGKRSKNQIKAKAPAYVDSMIVVGLVQGEGKRASTFGSFILARQTERGLEYACQAGSGLDDATLEEVWAARERIQIPNCPLVGGKPTQVQKPVLAWVRGMVADIKFEQSVKVGPRFPRVLSVEFVDTAPSAPRRKPRGVFNRVLEL